MPGKARYFDTEEETIRIAKQRAKSTCGSQYIYKNTEGMFRISAVHYHIPELIMKVKFDGTVERLNQEETAK
jgi:hypothetical protein